MTPAPPDNAKAAATAVIERLREAGHQALLAGGCVRDLLLGRTPGDFDVATNAVPAKVRKLFRRTLQVGAQFGVIIVLLGDQKVEVVTFRSESGYADGRHPDHVSFSDARQDALRRDFTINGMFMDPASGEIIDYVGGRDDLAAGVVRAIGDPAERFGEDQLRMLRAVRFAAALGFKLEPATARAIGELAPRIENVSAERIWQEWRKVLANPNRASAVRMADETGLLGAIWPELPADRSTIMGRLERLPAEADERTALAVQMLDLPVAQVHAVCRRLTLDNDSRESVAWLVEHRSDLLKEPLGIVPLKKLMADGNWTRLVALSHAVAEQADSAVLKINLDKAANIPGGEVAPPPLVDGGDLIAMGLVQGPRIGSILAQLYDEQLAGNLATKDQALARARQLLAQ